MDCVQCQFQYVVIANCVLCVFSIGNGPRRHRPPVGAASQCMLNQYYCYWAPATRHPVASFTNLQYGASSSAPFTNLKCVLLQEHRSPISSVAPSSSVVPISTLALLQVLHHSPISSVAPSTSVAPIVTVVLLQLHQSTVLLHFLATILCHLIMLCDDSILSIILLLV